jgi:hypothetical protein
VNGHYQKSDDNASFVVFVPSRSPALAILVVIDSPHGAGYTGGAVSAPVFKRIAESALTYLGIPPTLNPPPPVLMARRSEDDSSAVVPQPARMEGDQTAVLALAREGVMPDLRGFSAREALRALSQMGLTARMSGDGFVIAQMPEAGAALVPGAACTLKLDRRALTSSVTGGPTQ